MKRSTNINENKNIKFGALITYVTLFVSICIHVFYTPYFLRTVGDKSFGIFSFVSSITSWFTIGVYALNDSFTRFSTLERKENSSNSRTNTLYLKMLLIMACFIAIISVVILILLSTGIIGLDAYTYDERNTIYILYIISTFQIIAVTILTLFKLYIEYESNFIAVKSAMLIHSILNVILCVLALYLGYDVIIISGVQFITNLLLLGFYFLYATKYQHMTFAKEKISDNLPFVKTIASFSSFLLLSSIVTEIDYSVDKTILGFFAGAEYVTLYQLGMSFNTYFNELATAINSVFIPKINRYVANNDNEGINYVFLNMSLVQSVIVFLIIGEFIVCGREFIVWWVGPEKIAVYWIALVLLILSSYPCVSYSTVTIKRAMNKHRIPSIVRVFVAGLNVLLSVVLIVILPREKAIVACLIGTCISSVVGKWIFMFIYDSRVTGLPMIKLLKEFVLFLLITVVSDLITFYFFHIINLDGFILLQFLYRALFFFMTYFVLVYLFRGKRIFSFIKGVR